MAVSVVLARLAILVVEKMARVKVTDVVNILHPIFIKVLSFLQILMSVPLILIPVIKMQCVLTLMAVSLVHVTLDQLVMVFHVVSVLKKLYDLVTYPLMLTQSCTGFQVLTWAGWC